jgi:hypothetical protein
MRFTARTYRKAIQQQESRIRNLLNAHAWERADKRCHDLKLIKRRYFREC